MKLRYPLLFLFLLQLIIPIPTLLLGDAMGLLVGALVAAALTPPVIFALQRMYRFLLWLVNERVEQLIRSARRSPEAELLWLPSLRAAQVGLTRCLGPVSLVLLLAYLSVMLPGLFPPMLAGLPLLSPLAVIGLAILVLRGLAHQGLVRFLVGILSRLRQRNQPQAAPVIIVTDVSSQDPQAVPSLGGVVTAQALPGAPVVLLLPSPAWHGDTKGLPEPIGEERV